jgi:hypothetical protein
MSGGLFDTRPPLFDRPSGCLVKAALADQVHAAPVDAADELVSDCRRAEQLAQTNIQGSCTLLPRRSGLDHLRSVRPASGNVQPADRTFERAGKEA